MHSICGGFTAPCMRSLHPSPTLLEDRVITRGGDGMHGRQAVQQCVQAQCVCQVQRGKTSPRSPPPAPQLRCSGRHAFAELSPAPVTGALAAGHAFGRSRRQGASDVAARPATLQTGAEHHATHGLQRGFVRLRLLHAMLCGTLHALIRFISQDCAQQLSIPTAGEAQQPVHEHTNP